jgi:hypothetical protein
MILNQETVTLGSALIGASVYASCSMARGRKFRIESLLMFALLCAAVVTGGYITVAAFKDRNSSNALYCGVLGACLSFVMAQEAVGKFRALFIRTVKKGKESGAETDSEVPNS